MRQKVSYSPFCCVLTAVVTLLLLGGGIWFISKGELEKGWTMTGLFIVTALFALWYAPLSVAVDEEYVYVGRPLRYKRIPVERIRSVSYAPPTMAQKRVCASGGFMGYWGWFNERPGGNYFGYFGRSSDTFLLTLDNGWRYMLGCDNSQAMADAIRSLIARRKH